MGFRTSPHHPAPQKAVLKSILCGRRGHYGVLSKNIFVAALFLGVGVYVVLLQSIMSQTPYEEEESNDQCRTLTQRCISKSSSSDKWCTAEQELHLPWAPRVFHQRIPSENPLVCIVVTTHNIENYIGEALDTIVHQTYKNIEVLVVDDASTDGTLGVIQRYENLDSRVRVIELAHNTNGGAGQPSNIGMGKCSHSSEYIMIVDGDDYLEENAAALLVEHARSCDADLVMADFDSFTVDTTTKQLSFEPAYDHIGKWDNLPSDNPFNILTHPNVLRISPVPWRKMYKRSFIKEYDLKFPEGDYFFEDNFFHWLVLGHATRVTKIDQVLFHHRRQRTGQTSHAFQSGDLNATWRDVSDAARMSGYFPNLYQIGQLLFQGTQPRTNSMCGKLAVASVSKVYFEFLNASRWIAGLQKSAEMKKKFYNLFELHRNHWLEELPSDYVGGLGEPIVATSKTRQYTVDLSLILPTLNAADFLPELLESIYAGLSRPDFVFEVFAIDDGSSDDTVAILREFAKTHHSNFFILSTSSGQKQLGAGRARNRAIPLMEGRYAYFLDADDSYDFAALADAVEHATTQSIDLLILPYSTEFITAQEKEARGMLGGDKIIWTKNSWRGWQPTGHAARRSRALDLINYPWKQLTATQLMRDADVFFGPTLVHNDVQFHWTSITASRNLHFYKHVVCTHRKFSPEVRGQLTEVNSAVRMTALDAIATTERALARQNVFHGDDGKKVLDQWHRFAKYLIRWALARMPKDLIEEYNMRSDRMIQSWDYSTAESSIQKSLAIFDNLSFKRRR